MEVLGMIEIWGLVVLIEVFDVMVKVVCVKLVGVKQIGGGLCIVMVCGDVVVCKVVIDVGVVVVQCIGELVFVYVILCLYGDLEEVFSIGLKGDSSNL